MIALIPIGHSQLAFECCIWNIENPGMIQKFEHPTYLVEVNKGSLHPPHPSSLCVCVCVGGGFLGALYCMCSSITLFDRHRVINVKKLPALWVVLDVQLTTKHLSSLNGSCTNKENVAGLVWTSDHTTDVSSYCIICGLSHTVTVIVLGIRYKMQLPVAIYLCAKLQRAYR